MAMASICARIWMHVDRAHSRTQLAIYAPTRYRLNDTGGVLAPHLAAESPAHAAVQVVDVPSAVSVLCAELLTWQLEPRTAKNWYPVCAHVGSAESVGMNQYKLPRASCQTQGPNEVRTRGTNPWRALW